MRQNYPRWKYHRTLPARIVADPSAEAELGPEWANHPDELREPAGKPAKKGKK